MLTPRKRKWPKSFDEFYSLSSIVVEYLPHHSKFRVLIQILPLVPGKRKWLKSFIEFYSLSSIVVDYLPHHHKV